IRDGHVTGVQMCALPIFVAWLRTSVMRFCVALILIFGVLLLTACVFSQDSPSDSKSPVASKPAVLVSPPVDLKPDASGAVPPEQIGRASCRERASTSVVV